MPFRPNNSNERKGPEGSASAVDYNLRQRFMNCWAIRLVSSALNTSALGHYGIKSAVEVEEVGRS